MDLELIETNNGGDIVKNAKDVSVIFGFENMPYLAMFGGNVEESTPLVRKKNQQAFDFWGNNLLFPNDTSIQFNSETERTLNTVALNSFGRGLIEKAVVNDLKFMDEFADVKVEVTINSINKATIYIQIIKRDNLQKREFIYIWDYTTKELIQR